MRICPVCNHRLKEYNYFFCDECQTPLPQGLFKLPKPVLLNLKLKYEINPTYQFLFFKIPYENRFSANLISFIIILMSIILTILYLINSNFNLWM